MTFQAEVDAEENERLEGVIARKRSAEDATWYFPVAFRGLRDDHVSVRFGQVLWQRLEGGRARHKITLVAERNDSSIGAGLAGLFEPTQSRLIEHAVEARLTVEALITELENAGSLDERAVNRIRDAAANPPLAAFREFERALDLDSI